ncbi:hypothetical protein GSI_02658 [Ganoderma sinense ZZ0214-1]|uniref:Uncharacterized protein n=1 Tax=Ganoderma sinense ZZ0214-1 TaxID=1077348 RepID=A0A2G8SM87_9APHY|nr:hypothetical protein GSI_02658 [Ganoderma sinense ZZ0214-1]
MAEIRATSHRVKAKVVHSRRPPPDPTFAFGFALDYKYRRRWAEQVLEGADRQLEKPTTYTPQEYEDLIEGIITALNTCLPKRVYCALPDLPRIRRDLLPVEDGDDSYSRYVFALRDNSTSERLRSPLTKEHIDAVRKELGLEDDQQPGWFPIVTND